MRPIISSIESEYRRYKLLAEASIHQLTIEELAQPDAGSVNSVATIAWHVSANLNSRFTDFLTSDGEKPWRKRESEFEPRHLTHDELLEQWESGWEVLLNTLEALSDDDLTRSVTIRGKSLTVPEALHRSLAHVAYHVGQIVFIARAIRGADWEFLSIPPGATSEYNKNPTRENGPQSS
ncbi:MAG TPA: DUF1572 family protein [Candidatus Krumholzibacteria bacterium]|nr:DUF1572 family protein [Candidatus Krumholzibacteria bacterium]